MSCHKDSGSGDWQPVILIVILVLAPGSWAQTYKTLHKFEDRKDGGFPLAGLIFDRSGNLYGATGVGGNDGHGAVFELTPGLDGRWTEHVLYTFCPATNCIDGANPYTTLIFDLSGNLYGTTFLGGTHGGGTVFRLTPKSNGIWTHNTLYSFCVAANCDDGKGPSDSLIFDGAGNIYGTTTSGGAHAYGTVFKLTPRSESSWKESVLYSFCSLSSVKKNCVDGSEPYATLVLDEAGSLYGTTSLGGAYGEGLAFKLTSTGHSTWREDVLHHFGAGADGAGPLAGLIFDAVGNLYGTTNAGGNCKIAVGSCGGVFQLTPILSGGWFESVLHDFTGAEGWGPAAGLTFDGAGNLYGTTTIGGDLRCRSGYGCGVVFRLVPNSKGGWVETVMHAFADDPGALPWAGVTLDAEGKLYGTTYGDNVTTFGSLFEITP